jgi:hypothetical protein
MFFPSYNGRVKTADVIVAGRGIIGLTTAFEMARNGARVRIRWLCGHGPRSIAVASSLLAAGRPHCSVATEHFRNGILPAPATGLIVRQLLEGSAPAVELANLAPWTLSRTLSGVGKWFFVQVTRFGALRYKTDSPGSRRFSSQAGIDCFPEHCRQMTSEPFP